MCIPNVWCIHVGRYWSLIILGLPFRTWRGETSVTKSICSSSRGETGLKLQSNNSAWGWEGGLIINIWGEEKILFEPGPEAEPRHMELQLSMYSIGCLRPRLVWGPERRISPRKGVSDFCYRKRGCLQRNWSR